MKAFLVNRLLPLGDRLGGGLAVVAMVMIVALIGVMIFEVVSRRFLDAPTIWANDITYMTNGTLFLIGAAYTLRRNAHVRIDFFSSRFSVRVQHLINLVFYLGLFLPALTLTAYNCVAKAHRAFERGTLENMSTWEPVIWPFLTGIALGVVGLAVQVFLESVRHVIGVLDPEAVEPPSRSAREGVQ
ncbi:MAG: TRAP transporter small permease subunit [Ectothiorhodospiraceae bacterium]|nr:TRAP transporter small permease subunit [Chromatiales bacterium]MCP5155524.1 TRAP transporter small permease subunit [Ectothiorhodospiraceae bacterium]